MIKYSVYIKIKINLKSWFIYCASLIMHCIYIYINIFTYFTVQNLFYPHLPLPWVSSCEYKLICDAEREFEKSCTCEHSRIWVTVPLPCSIYAWNVTVILNINQSCAYPIAYTFFLWQNANPLILMTDQGRISICSISTISSRKVMRTKGCTKFSKLTS